MIRTTSQFKNLLKYGLLLSLCIWSLKMQIGFGQSSTAFDSEHARQSLTLHTKKVTTKSDFNEVPSHKVYRVVFLRSLFDQAVSAKFSSQDWEVITNLPSHQDSQFLNFTNNSVNNACNNVRKESLHGPYAARSVAEHYVNSNAEIEENLNHHYESVLEKLSIHGRNVVLQEVEKLRQTNAVSHSEVDMLAMSLDEPALTIEFIRRTCDNFEEKSLTRSEEKLFLRDDLSRAYDNDLMLTFDASK